MLPTVSRLRDRLTFAAVLDSMDPARERPRRTRALGKEGERMTCSRRTDGMSQGRGCGRRIGLPAARILPTYDAFYDAGIRHILVRMRPAVATPPRVMPRRPARSGWRWGQVARGATNLVTPISRRDDGLGSGGVPDWTGPDRSTRNGRLPRGRHDRDHDADRQAQFHDPAPAGRSRGRSTRRSMLPGPADRGQWWSTSRRTSAVPTFPMSR